MMGDDETDVQHRARLLREARQAAGFDGPAEAARALEGMGIKASTLTSHENGTRQITLKAAMRYEKVFPTARASELAGVRDRQENSSDVFIDSEEAAMGVWVEEALQGRTTKRRALQVPSRYAKRGRKAIRISDEHANLTINPGEYAIVKPWVGEAAEAPKHGRLVLVEVRRPSEDGPGVERERTIRQVRSDRSGRVTLRGHSSNPRLARDLAFPSAKAANSVTIIGVVVGKYTPLDDEND